MLKTLPQASPFKLVLLATVSGALMLTAGCAGKSNKNRDTAYVARDVDRSIRRPRPVLIGAKPARRLSFSTKWSASIPIRPGHAAPS